MTNKKGIAIVTGADAPIGRAVAIRLAAEGYDILAQCSVHDASLAEELSSAGVKDLAVSQDLRSADSVKELLDLCVDQLGRDVAVLVNAQRVLPPRQFTEATSQHISDAVAVNVLGSMHMVHFVLPLMLERKSGSIINVSDVSSFGDKKNAIFGATMAGLNGLTKLLAVDYTGLGISTNTVTACQYDDAFLCAPGQLSADAEDVADACAYLVAHPKLSGQNLSFAGGKPVL